MINERRQIDMEKVIGHVAVLMQDREKNNLCTTQICQQVEGLKKAVEELRPKPSRYLALALAILIPLISAIFGYGQLSGKVAETEARVAEKAAALQSATIDLHTIDQRLTRVEEISKRLESMERKIDKLADAVAARGRWTN